MLFASLFFFVLIRYYKKKKLQWWRSHLILVLRIFFNIFFLDLSICVALTISIFIYKLNWRMLNDAKSKYGRERRLVLVRSFLAYYSLLPFDFLKGFLWQEYDVVCCCVRDGCVFVTMLLTVASYNCLPFFSIVLTVQPIYLFQNLVLIGNL